MPRRFKVAITLSILFHLIVFLGILGFPFIGFFKRGENSVGSGVVWFNLNPGGEGSGGLGGEGAPKEFDGEAPVSKKSSGKFHKNLPVEKSSDLAGVAQEILPASEEVLPQLSTKLANKGPGLLGSGEGDSVGDKTGSSGGQGEGLGSGKGAGMGPGEGPGAEGSLGSGGVGSGGNGSALLGMIRKKIMNAKRYPRRAREDGVEGRCGLKFRISPDGSAEEVQLTTSSGYELLDEEAKATVKRAAPFPFYPGPIQLSLRFSLKETTDHRPLTTDN